MADRLILVSVGNTRTRVAVATDGQLEPSTVLENDNLTAIVQTCLSLAGGEEHLREEPGRVVIAAVNQPLANQLERALLDAAAGGASADGPSKSRSSGSGGRGTDRSPDSRAGHGQEQVTVLRFGRDLSIPIPNTLDDDTTVGQDRQLDALGAFTRSKQACIVIDAGTAVTVDFVDGQGVFHGGAIAPGVRMMARALHEHTAALPSVNIAEELKRIAAKPAPTPSIAREMEDSPVGPVPFGKTTSEAIAIGVASAVRGLVRVLIDRYAEYYGAYPRVVATGGDASMLFEHDELVEIIVPDLALVGMLAAVSLLPEAGELDLDDEERL